MARKIGSKVTEFGSIAILAIFAAAAAPESLSAQARATVMATATVVSGVPQQEVAATVDRFVTRSRVSTNATSESRRNALGGLVQMRAENVAEHSTQVTRVTLEYAAN